MEKLQSQIQFPGGTNRKTQPPEKSKQHLVWDCGSSLYDSFELNSFQRQLDSAISIRTMPMPHIVDHRRAPPLPPLQQQQPPPPVSKKSSKILRSFQKLFKSMFKSKHNFRLRSHDEEYYVYDKSGALKAAIFLWISDPESGSEKERKEEEEREEK